MLAFVESKEIEKNYKEVKSEITMPSNDKDKDLEEQVSGRYSIHVRCSNCEEEYMAHIPLGKTVSEYPCRNCLCITLVHTH